MGIWQLPKISPTHYFTIKHINNMCQKKASVYIAELLYPILVMDKVQEIHRFEKRKRAQIAVTISKSCMAWILAMCCVIALPRSSQPLEIKVKSDIEKNCSVLLESVKLGHSFNFQENIEALQFLFPASNDLCTVIFF